jgi:hypothetical protein
MNQQDVTSNKEFVTLKEYLLSRLDNHTSNFWLYKDTVEKRLEKINDFITRAEHDALIIRYDLEIKQLNRSKDLIEGKASITHVYISWLISLISLMISFYNVLHK